jgi:3-deoxy-manno-octulosonate cytidylyltransferase (CMP-KDO synthetase)
MIDNSIAVIPARYGSTRFPGKVLAPLNGKPMIQWVYEKAKASVASEVIVATDDQKVFDAVEKFGGKAVMTSVDHPSGTDRIYEAIQNTDKEIIINIQGDEPLIPTEVIDELITTMSNDSSIPMGTVAVKAKQEELSDPNKVKVVMNKDNFALYFSRAMIPFQREGGDKTDAFLHWGLYAYRRETLKKFISLPESNLEKCEKLEQLRALENGINIYVMQSNLSSIGVDTPEDLELAEQKMRDNAS